MSKNFGIGSSCILPLKFLHLTGKEWLNMSDTPDTAVIGLTGQSGAGKTTVCQVFAESGFAIINADQIARKIMEKGTPCLEEAAE